MSRYLPIDGYTKDEVLGYIKYKLMTDRKWQEYALLYLFDKQTDYEKRSNSTVKENEVGFDQVDAIVLTKIAKILKSKNPLNEYHYSQMKKRLKKYSEQIESNCNVDKLKLKLNKFYYGDENHIDCRKLDKYLEGFDKIHKFDVGVSGNELYVIRERPRYIYEFKFTGTQLVVKACVMKDKTFNCDRNKFNEVIDYFKSKMPR